MITIQYTDELGNKLSSDFNDWEAVELYAEVLVNAPIDLDFIEYYDIKNGKVGTFNLHTFTRE